MKKLLLVLLCLGLFSASMAQGTDNVRLFQNYFYDTPISSAPYVQPGLAYGSYDGFSTMDLGAQGGYVVNPTLEIQGKLGYVSWKPEKGDGESGLSDLAIYGRKLISDNKNTQFAAGGMITLPIGSEDVGQGHLNFGGFGAVRHKLESGMVITGTIGLIFYEYKTYEYDYQTMTYDEKKERDNYLNLGAGVLYPVNKQTCIVGEFSMQSEGDYTMLSGGVDYTLKNGAKVRGALGLGLDDGAPDLLIMGGYEMTLGK